MSHIDSSTLIAHAKSNRKRFWRELFIHEREAWAELRMDNVLRTTAALPPRPTENVSRTPATASPAAQESGRLPYTFVVGSFGTNITIHDQQWRGLELAEAIIRILNLRENDVGEPCIAPRVCIVGGGFAGTAAAMWFLKSNVDFKLVEKHELLTGEFYASDCWVHPNVWDWPLFYDAADEEGQGTAGEHWDKTYFPECVDSLNWVAGSIKDVADAVRAKVIARISAAVEDGKRLTDMLVKDEIEASDIQSHDNGVWVRVRGTWEYFNFLLLCVGFGTSRQLQGAVKSAEKDKKASSPLNFWKRCGNHRYPNNTRHLIYGGGDTALMEAIQRCTVGHQQPFQLLQLARNCGLSGSFERLGEKFRRADQDYEVWRGLADDPSRTLRQIRRNADSLYLDAVVDFFDELHASNEQWQKWERWVAQALDWNQRVVLAMRHEIIRARSARLKRVLCVLLHAASRFYWMKNEGVEKKNYQRIFKSKGKQSNREESKFRERLRGLPLLNRDENAEIGNPNNPKERGYSIDKGLMIVGNVKWIGQTEIKPGDRDKSHHLARVEIRGRSFVAAGEYNEFVPCIGQEEPALLRELSDRVDINSLRIRQKDWRWY